MRKIIFSDYDGTLDTSENDMTKNIEAIQNLKNSNLDADVFMFKYSMGFDEENKPTLIFYRERLLKREKNFKWQGFVHEAITPCGKIEYTNIEIEHRKLHEHEKGRNLKLFENAIENEIKLTPRELYYYARELYYNNKIEKAIKTFNEYLTIPNTYKPDNMTVHILLSECYKIQNNPSLAIDTLFLAIKKHTPTAEICCKIAYLFDASNEKEQAIFWFKSALHCHSQTDGFINQDFQEFLPCLELSRLLFSKNFSEAKEYHIKAKRLHPNHSAIIFNTQFFEN